MFVIELIYQADLADIDVHMAAHVRFLKKYYASRQQIEAIVAEDPFVINGLADFRIIEFRASQRADDIQKRIANY